MTNGELIIQVVKYTFQHEILLFRYRAEVLSVDKEKEEAELHFVDYGDTDSVSFQNIMELRTDFLRLHFQAIECYLEDIGENVQNALLIYLMLHIIFRTCRWKME